MDERNFRFPKGVTPPTEKEVVDALRSKLEGYTGPGAGFKGKFWAGVNLTILELPPATQDEGEPPTPEDVKKTLEILAPPGSPPEQIAAAMKMVAELKKAKESK